MLYRLSLFDTAPHDDYTGYRHWIVGRPGGLVPHSPYANRWLSAAAWPLFELMPLIRLTNTPQSLSDDMIRAVAALSMLSYLAMLGTAFLTFRLGRTEGGLVSRTRNSQGEFLVKRATNLLILGGVDG